MVEGKTWAECRAVWENELVWWKLCDMLGSSCAAPDTEVFILFVCFLITWQCEKIRVENDWSILSLEIGKNMSLYKWPNGKKIVLWREHVVSKVGIKLWHTPPHTMYFSHTRERQSMLNLSLARLLCLFFLHDKTVLSSIANHKSNIAFIILKLEMFTCIANFRTGKDWQAWPLLPQRTQKQIIYTLQNEISTFAVIYLVWLGVHNDI